MPGSSLLTLHRRIKMMVQSLVCGFFLPLLPETLLVFYVQPLMLLGPEVGVEQDPSSFLRPLYWGLILGLEPPVLECLEKDHVEPDHV